MIDSLSQTLSLSLTKSGSEHSAEHGIILASTQNGVREFVSLHFSPQGDSRLPPPLLMVAEKSLYWVESDVSYHSLEYTQHSRDGCVTIQTTPLWLCDHTDSTQVTTITTFTNYLTSYR